MTEAELHQRLIETALELFGATHAAAFLLPIPNTTPPLFLCCGEEGSIRALLEPASTTEG